MLINPTIREATALELFLGKLADPPGAAGYSAAAGVQVAAAGG
jgi:hypothetical protein